MRLIDAQFMETPWYGSRLMTRYLRRGGHGIHHNRIRRLMAMIGLVPIYQRRRTTILHPEHQIYPYLLRDLTIHRPNQVCCMDITYISMQRGFLYLVAVIDWWTRKMLSWRISNSMDVGFCNGEFEEAVVRHGRPEVFYKDQGSQFTSPQFAKVLRDAVVRISMDDKGRWMDNERTHAEVRQPLVDPTPGDRFDPAIIVERLPTGNAASVRTDRSVDGTMSRLSGAGRCQGPKPHSGPPKAAALRPARPGEVIQH